MGRWEKGILLLLLLLFVVFVIVTAAAAAAAATGCGRFSSSSRGFEPFRDVDLPCCSFVLIWL